MCRNEPSIEWKDANAGVPIVLISFHYFDLISCRIQVQFLYIIYKFNKRAVIVANASRISPPPT